MMLFESQKEDKNQFLMERKRKNNEKVFKKKKTHKNAKTILVVAGKLKRKLKRYKENRFKIDDEKIW